LQPYIVKQGDHLAKLAYKFGFDADAVWKDPQNEQLRQQGYLSQDPNILNPTDMLYIPGDTPPTMHTLTVGCTNTFVSDAPSMTLTLKLVGQDSSRYSSRPYTIQELDQLSGLKTDGDGVLTFKAPVTLNVATVVFSDNGETWVLSIGHLDPIDTLSGVFQRLQNLGFLGGELNLEAVNLDVLRLGLWALKASQSGSSNSSAPASAPAPDSAPESDSGADSTPPSSGNVASDNAGLGDDGTLDAATTSLLLKAYGC
jgi:N-acetylmuramoyl-L-alanine amidase